MREQCEKDEGTGKERQYENEKGHRGEGERTGAETDRLRYCRRFFFFTRIIRKEEEKRERYDPGRVRCPQQRLTIPYWRGNPCVQCLHGDV